MTTRMMGYVNTPRQMPDKRSAEQRRRDFDEIYNEFDAQKAAEQANRCAQCGVPFCQVYCPLHNNIPDWLRLTAEGRLEEAYEVASSTNTFPEICGRICPKDRLCEGNCVIEQAGHGTVTIGSVEKYITEKAFDNDWAKPRLPEIERDAHVGIIGAGPAGLAAAEMLRAWGYQVTVYDRYDRIGGLMIYGIPNFKMDKYVMARRVEQLEDQGIVFCLNTETGRDITFDALRARHDSILITTGVYAARDLDVPGNDLEGVVPALEFLVAENRHGLGDDVPEQESGRLNANNRNVVVIGGGDTAMDCVRTAVRQGAQHVTCLYRRDRPNMPGSAREVHNAEEEGVVFEWLKAPNALYGDEYGHVTSCSVQPMQLGDPDESGRRAPVPADAAAYDMECDMVIKALGFEAEDLPALFDEPELTVRNNGTLAVDSRTLMTAMDGVFAAGDIVRGASLVVWGIRDGRDAAQAMHDYMQDTAQAGVAAE